MSTVSERLGRFAAELDAADLPAAVLDKAKACIAHGLIVGAASQATEFGRLAEEAAAPVDGPARLLTSGRPASAAQAAFVNAALLHGRVQEDTHGTSHLGTMVLPAALAVAQERDVDGRTLLAGIVAGYEVGAALGKDLTGSSSARGFRASAIYGPLAAAAAAGRVIGLDADHLATAIGFASAFAGGTLESFAAGSMEWHFQNAMAAQTGVLAARLAEAGGEAAAEAFEGSAGFLRAFPDSVASAATLAESLGADWELLDVTFKLYPVCAFNQIPVEAAIGALRAAGVSASEVESLAIQMNAYEAGYPGMSRSEGFQTTSQTLMSTRFAVASGLVHGNVTYADLERFEDPDVLSLIERIDVRADPERPQMTVRVTLKTTAGEEHVVAIDDPNQVLVWDFARAPEMAQRLLAETLLSEEDLNALLSAIGRIESLGSVDELLDPLLAPFAHTR